MTAKSTDYDVGYRKPPPQHHFKKGRSGNPKGRPRKPKPEPPEDPIEAIARALMRERDVVVGGRKTQMAAYDILAQKLVDGCLNAAAKDQMRIAAGLQGMGVFDKIREFRELDREAERVGFSAKAKETLDQITLELKQVGVIIETKENLHDSKRVADPWL